MPMVNWWPYFVFHFSLDVDRNASPSLMQSLDFLKVFCMNHIIFWAPYSRAKSEYVVLTYDAICASALSKLLLWSIDSPTGFFSWCSCIPITGSRLRPMKSSRISSTTMKEVIWIIHPPDSIGTINWPNEGIFYPF